MSANIEISRTLGREAFAMRATSAKPWWGIGHEIQGNDLNQWRKESGLDWLVGAESVYAHQFREVDDMLGGKISILVPERLTDAQAFRRSDNGRVLCTVGAKTTPYQNEQIFSWFQPFVDAKKVELETAMSLDQGRRVVVTAKIVGGCREIVPGDPVETYLMFSHANDGSLAVHIGITPVRVVCANTEAMARSDKRSKLIKIRHGRDVVARVEDVQSIMESAFSDINYTFDQYQALAAKKNINTKSLRQFFKTVFKMEENAETGKMATRTQNTLDELLRMHDSRTGIVTEMLTAMKEREEKEQAEHALIGKATLEALMGGIDAGIGADIPDARNSWWSALNVASEFLTHSRGRTPETLASSNLFGANAETNKLALETAMVMSGLQSA